MPSKMVRSPPGTGNGGFRQPRSGPMAKTTSTKVVYLAGAMGSGVHDDEKPVGMQEQLQALQHEDPRTVLIVRCIHTLGFQSAQILEGYFRAFGTIKSVLVPYSRVKASPGRRARARTGNIGFIVMHSAHAAQSVLSLGDQQEICGAFVTVSPFEKREGASCEEKAETGVTKVMASLAQEPHYSTHDMPSSNQSSLGLISHDCNSPGHMPIKHRFSPMGSIELSNDSTGAGSSGSSGSSTPSTHLRNPRWTDIADEVHPTNDEGFYANLENRLDSMVLAEQGFVTDDEF